MINLWELDEDMRKKTKKNIVHESRNNQYDYVLKNIIKWK